MSFKHFIGTLLLALAACTPRPSQGLPSAAPSTMGMSAEHLALIDSTVRASIDEGDIPGATVGVVRHGALVYAKGFNYPRETLFDLASLTKCLCTTVAVMQLVERGQLRLVDPVSRYIPGFLPWTDPESGSEVPITVQHLLTHSSGLDAVLPSVDEYLQTYGPGTPEQLLGYISTCSARNFRPGTDVLYSCLNFVVLQHIVQRITGQRLCDYAQSHIFGPLGLSHTAFFPLDGSPVDERLAALCAPTEVQADGKPLQAQVHDPMARLINLGNSGNAGMFSSLDDVAVMAAALLGGGALEGRRILMSETVRKMFELPYPGVPRALGWDTYLEGPYTSGDIFPLADLRGHTGYTGTSLILSRELDMAVIVLSNRVYPHDDGSTSRLRSTVASIAAAAVLER